MLSIGFVPSAAHSQTLFQSYDTTATLARYLSVEDCLAAVNRVTDSLKRARPEFVDTMPYRKDNWRDSTPPAVIEIARQCAARFNPDSVDLTGIVQTHADWIQLYLAANRDDAADIVAQRRISMTRQEDSITRFKVLGEIAGEYQRAHPMRWSKVLEYGEQLEAAAPDSFRLSQALSMLFLSAQTVEDSVVAEKMAQRILSVLVPLPSIIRGNPVFTLIAIYRAFDAKNYLTRVARMDSLRRGPEAYIAISRANWKAIGGNSKVSLPYFIGEDAVPLKAEAWYASSDASVATASDHLRPALGKVSLVVFLREGCSRDAPPFRGILDRGTQWFPSCSVVYAVLRRLAIRYPSVEVTIVSRTSGYIPTTGTATPAEEGALMQKWWLGFHRLPGTLAVATTQFFRLGGLDNRRIDQPVSNDVNYLFGQRGDEVDNGTAYLIDTNGRVLSSDRLSVYTESEFMELLDVIMQRGK